MATGLDKLDNSNKFTKSLNINLKTIKKFKPQKTLDIVLKNYIFSPSPGYKDSWVGEFEAKIEDEVIWQGTERFEFDIIDAIAKSIRAHRKKKRSFNNKYV